LRAPEAREAHRGAEFPGLGLLLARNRERAFPQSWDIDEREVLAPVYGWFTEGFDPRDLKEAEALLEELASGN